MSSYRKYELRSDSNGRLNLRREDIHLWAVFCDDVHNEQLLQRYRDILSESEREQESRFHFARDRQRYLVTRVLVRTILSRYCGIPPEEWSFELNSYGRPEVRNAGITPEGLRFNISHADTMILLGVTCRRDIGVDVENVSRTVSPVEIGERFFSASEYSDLCRYDGEAQKQRFFEYWTLKEAYVKARGMGLSIPLDKFSFHFRSKRDIAVTFDESLSERKSAWMFWLLRPAAQYTVAVCAGRGSGLAERVSLKATIPLIGDSMLPLSIMRASK